MKNGVLFFFGVFASLALSWAVLVLGAQQQLTSLRPFVDPIENSVQPQPLPGATEQGMDVYRSLGCASCHTQQVRRPGYGYDKERGWGARQSVARDYLYHVQPVLGRMRRGPDLSNLGERVIKTGLDREKLLMMLYAEHQPSFRFLFEKRRIEGAPLPSALKLPLSQGGQLVPTPRAEALVAYLMNLKQDYLFPEAQPIEAPKQTQP